MVNLDSTRVTHGLDYERERQLRRTSSASQPDGGGGDNGALKCVRLSFVLEKRAVNARLVMLYTGRMQKEMLPHCCRFL